MNLKKLGIIIQREYLNKVKKKSFLLTTFGVPILFAGMYAAMIFIMLKAEGDSKRIAVIDNSGIVMEKLENTKQLTFTQLSEIGVGNHLCRQADGHGDGRGDRAAHQRRRGSLPHRLL